MEQFDGILVIMDSKVSQWEKSGLLDTVEAEKKILLSMALDIFSFRLAMSLEASASYRCNLIPVIVRIFRETNKIFTYDTLTESIRVLISDFFMKYEKAGISEYHNKIIGIGDIDVEAEFIKDYCDTYEV